MVDPTLCAMQVEEATNCEAPAVMTLTGVITSGGGKQFEVTVGVCEIHRPWVVDPNPSYSVGYGIARCASCGQDVEGTVDYLRDVHVPACIEREQVRRTRG